LVPVLFGTADGGKTWQRQTYPDTDNEIGWLEIADATHVLIVELNDLVVTADGKTWRHTRIKPACANTKNLAVAEHGSDTWSGTAVHFLHDGKNAWWGNESDLFHSTDGGQTWCQLPGPLYQGKPVKFRRIDFTDVLHGWAIPQFADEPPFVTRDGGRRWQPIQVAGAAEAPAISGMSVLDATHVWMWDCNGVLYQSVVE
jgi:photosystem II stability/assembly factor-like uncharacterized protein